MDFLRRLIGGRSNTAPTTGASNASNADARVANTPEISPPGTALKATQQSPVIDTPLGGTTKPLSSESAAQQALLYGSTRQLPPLESFVSKPNKHLIFGLNSDIGMVRNNNQDSLYIFFGSNVSADGVPDFGLFVVADGMGGHHDGERASAIATRVIGSHMLEAYYLKLIDQALDDKPIISEVLSDAFQKANEAINDEIPEGGTTCTAIAIVGDLMYVAHVGDSRAYLITAEGVEQVTRDHSLVQRLIELDQLTAEEAASHPQRNVLYRALGQAESVEIDMLTRRLVPGSRLLICSDGLWNYVLEDRLLQVVQNSKSPQESCDRLVNLANERGGPDNITIVLIQVPG